MDMGMKFKVRTKGMQHTNNAHAHPALALGPILNTLSGGSKKNVETHLSVQKNDGPELPRDRENQMMIANIQKVIEHSVGPFVCGMLPTGGAKSRLTGVRNNPHVTTTRTTIQTKTKNRSPAGNDLSDCLEYDRSDPPFVLLDKCPPMEDQYL
jgi:hypothetical protein